MFLPLSDAPNPRGTPVVNYALIAINVAVYLLVTLPLSGAPPDPGSPELRAYVEFLVDRFGSRVPTSELVASVSSYDLLVFRRGFRPVDPSIATLFSSMFLHGGLLHLAGNMLFLWIYGDNVEHRLGRLGYLVSYLGCGVAATLGHAAFDLDSGTPMVGASGAISGVLGFYYLFFPHNRVRVFVMLFPFLVDVVTVSARFVLGVYVLLDNLLPFLVTRGVEGGGVAYGAHLGGFVAGIAVAWLLDSRERVAVPRAYRPPRKPAGPAPNSARDLAELVRRGRLDDAAKRYFAADEPTADAVAPGEALALARWLAEAGHPEAALSIYRRVLRRYRSGPVAAQAHLGAGLVQLRALGRPASAWQHFLDAIDRDPDGEAAKASRRGLREIEALQKLRVRGRR